MSLGWIQANEPVNTFFTPREDVANFTHWCDAAP
jgi:hypothetical protein